MSRKRNICQYLPRIRRGPRAFLKQNSKCVGDPTRSHPSPACAPHLHPAGRRGCKLAACCLARGAKLYLGEGWKKVGLKQSWGEGSCHVVETLKQPCGDAPVGEKKKTKAEALGQQPAHPTSCRSEPP